MDSNAVYPESEERIKVRIRLEQYSLPLAKRRKNNYISISDT